MHPVSYTNTHDDVTDLVNREMVNKYKILEYLKMDSNFLTKSLICAPDNPFSEVIVFYLR